MSAADKMAQTLEALLVRVKRGYDGLPQGQGVRMAEEALSSYESSKAAVVAGEGEAVGSSACPICGKDTPHAHHTTEVIDWLRAQASRFVGDADKTLNISLRRDAPEEKLRQEVEHLKKIIEHREDDDREERVRAMVTASRLAHPTPPTSAAVPETVWEAASKTTSMLFATEHDANKWIGRHPLSVTGGFSIIERPVLRMAAAPTQPAGEQG